MCLISYFIVSTSKIIFMALPETAPRDNEQSWQKMILHISPHLLPIYDDIDALNLLIWVTKHELIRNNTIFLQTKLYPMDKDFANALSEKL